MQALVDIYCDVQKVISLKEVSKKIGAMARKKWLLAALAHLFRFNISGRAFLLVRVMDLKK